MVDWLLWLIVAVGLSVGEVLTLSFFLFPFAVGAGGAAVAAGVGAGLAIQFLVFTALSLASLTIVRPIARRHLRTPPSIQTGTAALVGRSALALEEITDTSGTVKLEGEVWTARAFDDDQRIAAGTKVHVVEIKGATALVTD
jgi:membrane protein implicated in regulation of membrane protease activity